MDSNSESKILIWLYTNLYLNKLYQNPYSFTFLAVIILNNVVSRLFMNLHKDIEFFNNIG